MSSSKVVLLNAMIRVSSEDFDEHTGTSSFNEQLKNALKIRFGISSVPRLLFSTTFSPLFNPRMCRKLLKTLTLAANLPESLTISLLDTTRVVQSSLPTVGGLTLNYIRFCKTVTPSHDLKCCCEPVGTDHVISDGDLFEEKFASVIRTNSSSSPTPSTLTAVPQFYAAILFFTSALMNIVFPDTKLLNRKIIDKLPPFHLINSLKTLLAKLIPEPDSWISTFLSSCFTAHQPFSSQQWCTESTVRETKDALKGWIFWQLDKNLNKTVVSCPYWGIQRLIETFPIIHILFFPLDPQPAEQPHYSFYQHPEDFLLDKWRLWIAQLPKHLQKLCDRTPSKLPYAYILPKHKDWSRMRPVISYVTHPLNRLFNFIGRALHFLMKLLPIFHFNLWNEREIVPRLQSQFARIQRKFADRTGYLLVSADIKSMFTNLPHKIILAAISWLLHMIYNFFGYSCVYVSKGKTSFFPFFGAKKISFDLIRDICKFDLDNACFTLVGAIIRQIFGIPQGSPTSPALAVLVCIYSEHKWLQSHKIWSSCIATARYMDDTAVIICYPLDDPEGLQHALTIAHSLEVDCYHSSLTFEMDCSSKSVSIMRCILSVAKHNLIFNYNNKNLYQHITGTQTFIRYQHYHSWSDHKSKESVAVATLRDIAHFTTLPHDVLYHASMPFIELHSSLQYPWRFLSRIAHKARTHDPAHTAWPLLSTFCRNRFS
jgi:hypothetical protein